MPNEEQIAYRERTGGEKTVILVHGNMTSSKHWDLLIEALDQKYKVYAPDLRGFGESSYHNRVTSIKDFSDDLKGFVDAPRIERFLFDWLVYWRSCLMQFAADYPGYCEKLVLLASASHAVIRFSERRKMVRPDLEHRLVTIQEVEQDTEKQWQSKDYTIRENKEGLKAVWNALIYTHNKPDDEKYEQYVDDMLTQKNLGGCLSLIEHLQY